MRISTDTETVITIDKDGNESSTTVEKTHKVEISTEPDYIKLYTRMWCEFNEIPMQWRPLFLALALRMNYCNHGEGQIVTVTGVILNDIMEELQLKNRSQITRGLAALCKFNAIKRVARGQYQINPQYAGRGEWKYNPKLDRGGIEDLVAIFNFRDKKVTTEITWADDGAKTPINDLYRQGLGVKPSDNAVIKTSVSVPAHEIADADLPL